MADRLKPAFAAAARRVSHWDPPAAEGFGRRHPLSGLMRQPFGLPFTWRMAAHALLRSRPPCDGGDSARPGVSGRRARRPLRGRRRAAFLRRVSETRPRHGEKVLNSPPPPLHRREGVPGRRRAGILDRCIAAALIALGDGVGGDVLDLGAIGFGGLLRGPADALAVVAAPVGGRVVRAGPDHGMAGARGQHAAFHQPGKVGIGEPGGEHPAIDRLGEAGADAEVDVLDAVLVPVHAAHQLAIGFGQPVIAVGAEGAVGIEARWLPAGAHGSRWNVGGGEDDPGALPPAAS